MHFYLFYSVFYYLGYSSEEITNRSWYSLIHPDDLPLSAESHKSLGKYPIHFTKNKSCNNEGNVPSIKVRRKQKLFIF